LLILIAGEKKTTQDFIFPRKEKSESQASHEHSAGPPKCSDLCRSLTSDKITLVQNELKRNHAADAKVLHPWQSNDIAVSTTVYHYTSDIWRR